MPPSTASRAGKRSPGSRGARAVGTTIRVKDLFYNTPARMKFLKKDSSEGTFVADTIAHVALSHPEVSVKFIREGKLQYVTPGDGQLRSAAYAVLGREFSRDLIELKNQEGVYRITGLITPPKSCRASRSMQHFYINGRYVRNRTMMAGMEMAFKGTMMQGKFPGGILLLEMPADLVDVNVHPAKVEVRFAREMIFLMWSTTLSSWHWLSPAPANGFSPLMQMKRSKMKKQSIKRLKIM